MPATFTTTATLTLICDACGYKEIFEDETMDKVIKKAAYGWLRVGHRGSVKAEYYCKLCAKERKAQNEM